MCNKSILSFSKLLCNTVNYRTVRSKIVCSSLYKTQRRTVCRTSLLGIQVVHELIKLESEYSEVVGTSKTAKALVKNFDVDLVAKVGSKIPPVLQTYFPFSPHEAPPPSRHAGFRDGGHSQEPFAPRLGPLPANKKKDTANGVRVEQSCLFDPGVGVVRRPIISFVS